MMQGFVILTSLLQPEEQKCPENIHIVKKKMVKVVSAPGIYLNNVGHLQYLLYLCCSQTNRVCFRFRHQLSDMETIG